MVISDDIVKKIRISNDIVDVIGKYITLTPKGKNYFGICPFHDDHSPSMSVSPEKQIYTCFSCGATGNIITFVMNYEKVGFVDALKILGENCGVKIDNTYEKKISKENKIYYELYDTASKYYKNNLFSSLGKEAREYLASRQINDEIIKDFDIGLSLNNSFGSSLSQKYGKDILIEMDICKNINGKLVDSFRNRIMFPIKDNDGNIVAFSGRIYNNDDSSKYVNTTETKIFKKGKILYNLSNAKDYIRREKNIIICEGQMDSIRISSIGVKNVVSLLGTSLTKDQFEILKKLNVKVILNLDQDDAGKTATFNIGNLLVENGIDVSVIIFNEYKDSDELIVNKGKEIFIKALNNKVSFIDFKINYLKSKRNLEDSVELSKYINEVLYSINKIDDDILREIKIKELSNEFQINESILKSKLSISNKKVILNPKRTIKKAIYNKYLISEIRIIYLMLEYEEVIKIYEKNLGYLISEEMTNFANEIVNFKYKNKGFDYADFITYITEEPKLNDILKIITSYNNINEYNEDELNDYINNIKEYSVKKEIEKLKNKMLNELDVEEKKKIAKKIEDIKKEVLEW